MPLDRDELLDPQVSIIYSVVKFVDGSQVGQLSLPDMRLPIQYALTYPAHAPSPCQRLSLAEVGTLRFQAPDEARFPALPLARAAGERGGTYPTVLSAADEVAVAAFLADKVRFVDIAAIVADVLDRHRPSGPLTFEAIADADRWARDEAEQIVSARTGAAR